jgi:uncharacterized SAM-binding protein YcdF (DUF218 family)
VTPRSRRPLAVAALLAAALVVLVVAAQQPALRLIGRSLVVEDALVPADAIVVVAGGIPTHEATAAGLYRRGWAPLVVLSNNFTPDRVRQLIALGARPLDFQGESRLVLEKHGVPPDAIVALSVPVKTTEAELRLVAETVRAKGWRRIILVTSPHHSRRVKLVWTREAPVDIEGLVALVKGNDFPGDGWWRKRRQAEAVLHEYLGLAAIYLGVSKYLN